MRSEEMNILKDIDKGRQIKTKTHRHKAKQKGLSDRHTSI